MSLLPPIYWGLSITEVTTEEHVILHAQHLYFIYLQLGTLYDIIPNSHRPSTYPRKPTPGPHVNGAIGFVSHAYMN